MISHSIHNVNYHTMFLQQVKVFLAIAKLITTCFSLPLSQFYPYGIRNGDTELVGGSEWWWIRDRGFGEIRIPVLFPYFDRNYGSLYVSTTVPTALIATIFDINC